MNLGYEVGYVADRDVIVRHVGRYDVGCETD
jgi:hypothetical protein